MRTLSTRTRSSLVAHGVVVVVLGLLAGFPYALVVLGDMQGEVRAWRMAHLEGVLNGMLMIAVAAAGGLIALGPRQERWLWAGLLAAGYGNVVASVVGATFGVRGLAPGGPAANWVVLLLFSAAIVGVLLSLFLVGGGAFRRAAAAGERE